MSASRPPPDPDSPEFEAWALAGREPEGAEGDFVFDAALLEPGTNFSIGIGGEDARAVGFQVMAEEANAAGWNEFHFHHHPRWYEIHDTEPHVEPDRITWPPGQRIVRPGDPTNPHSLTYMLDLSLWPPEGELEAQVKASDGQVVQWRLARLERQVEFKCGDGIVPTHFTVTDATQMVSDIWPADCHYKQVKYHP